MPDWRSVGTQNRIRNYALYLLVLAGLIVTLPGTAQADEPGLQVTAPRIILKGIPFRVMVERPEGIADSRAIVTAATGEVLGMAVDPTASGAFAGSDEGPLVFEEIVVTRADQVPLRVMVGDQTATIDHPVVPGWLTIMPPLLAIMLALLLREVITSLFAGIWLGAFFLQGYNPFTALLMTVDELLLGALGDGSRGSILIFSLLLGGMVGVLNKMGASTAIVEAVMPVATSRRRGQLATWLAGLAIFFDDYANTLIVGNTMRPIADRLRISREKLSYIVDSTAAPVVVIAVITSWVGFEISLLKDAFEQLGIDRNPFTTFVASIQYSFYPILTLVFVSTWVGYEVGLIDAGLKQFGAQSGTVAKVTAFSVFINSIPFLFYPLFALFFILLLVLMKRDFGPMLAAERRAVSGGGLYDPNSNPAAEVEQSDEIAGKAGARWWMAAAPVVVVVVTVLAGLIHTGREALGEGQLHTLQNIFGAADPYKPLLWGTLLGCITAMSLAVGARLLSLNGVMKAWITGLKGMLMAVVILLLAWSLGDVTQSLGTASYLTSVLSDAMPSALLPAAVFLVAGLISFATGTSWATMAILYPLVIPLAMNMGGVADPASPVGFQLLLGSIAGVMAGSLFGDHCSPISDTTVLSSMASGCDHLDHVKTQLPYAMVTAGVAMLAGALPIGFGVSPWISLVAGAVILILIVRFVGKPVGEIEPDH
jgi:Na+/H+ antiporter NhaC